MKPVRVKTVQVKSAPIKLASAGRRAAPRHQHHPAPRRDVAGDLRTPLIAKAEHAAAARQSRHRPRHARRAARLRVSRDQLRRRWPRPSRHRAAPPASAVQQNGAIKPVTVHTGWIIQVGALESESEAQAPVSTPRATRPAACSARPIRSPKPSCPRATRKLYPRPLRRPRSRRSRSGLPEAEALRHFLLHHQELSRHQDLALRRSVGRARWSRRSCRDVAHRRAAARRRAASRRDAETARSKPLVKNCAIQSLKQQTTPDNGGQSGRRHQRSEKHSQSVALSCVAGVSCDACEAKYPWPRLHGRQGTSTPLGRDAVSSSGCDERARSRPAPRPAAGQGSDRPPRSSFCRSTTRRHAPLPRRPCAF